MSIKDIILRKIAAASSGDTVSYQEAMDSAESGQTEMTEDRRNLNDLIADKLLKPRRGQAVKILRAIINGGGGTV